MHRVWAIGRDQWKLQKTGPPRDKAAGRLLWSPRAGMAPSSRSSRTSSMPGPRARGDGPSESESEHRELDWSPRARGWPLPAAQRESGWELVPARAGMAPTVPPDPSLLRTGPRARGDGPRSCGITAMVSRWSPRARGWPLVGGVGALAHRLVPARAGMAPSAPGAPTAPPPGPRGSTSAFSVSIWSPRAGMAPWRPRPPGGGRPGPRARGWPRRAATPGSRGCLVPARAGKAPR